MKRWNRGIVFVLRKIGLKRRLFLSFLMISILPLAVFCFFMGRYIYETIMENYKVQSIQTLNNLEYRITMVLDKSSKKVNDFASDLSVVKNVTKNNKKATPLEKTVLEKNLQEALLAELCRGQNEVRAEILYKDGTYMTGVFEERYRGVEEGLLEKMKKDGARLQIRHESAGNEQVLIFARQIINYFSGAPAGLVIMYQNTLELEREMNAMQLSQPDSVIAVYDEEGRFICSSKRDGVFTEKGEQDLMLAGACFASYTETNLIWKQNWKLEGETYQVLFKTMDEAGFHIAIFQNYNRLQQSFWNLGILIFAIVTASVCVILVMSYLMTKTVAAPVSNIAEQMQLFSAGNLDARVEDSSRDEIGILGNEFNAMSNSIKRLTNEVYEAKIKEKEADLRALEAQINPHFLYNTLDMINWMSFQSCNQDICKIVKALSDFFRLSLNNGKELYTVGDERNHIKSYITIEQYKMSEIKFALFMEEELEHCVCPKLIVQPLVENAIMHGIDAGLGYGNIWITFQEDGEFVLLRVEDDGIGLQGNKKADAKYHKGGYGILNINERLHMLYGNNYCITVREREAGGVISEIRIPKIKAGNVHQGE